MEIQDELMTPGCPQCAIKHLSAALYHRAKMGAANEQLPPLQAGVCKCIAAINLVEVLNGSMTHNEALSYFGSMDIFCLGPVI